jgi:cell wall assembly regulator SMI1
MKVETTIVLVLTDDTWEASVHSIEVEAPPPNPFRGIVRNPVWIPMTGARGNAQSIEHADKLAKALVKALLGL